MERLLDENHTEIGGGTKIYTRRLEDEVDVVLDGDDDDADIVTFASVEFYRRQPHSSLINTLINILTFGIISLISQWDLSLYPKLHFWKRLEKDDEGAEFVVVKSHDGISSLEDITVFNAEDKNFVPVKDSQKTTKKVLQVLIS